MNREIIFRGIYQGDSFFPRMMVYGSLISYEDGERIIVDEKQRMQFSVVPGTVGQYTGFYLHSVPVFEGDIIKTYSHSPINGKSVHLTHTVEWSQKYAGWYLRNTKEAFAGDGGLQLWLLRKELSKEARVSGNIYENQELFGKEQGE